MDEVRLLYTPFLVNGYERPWYLRGPQEPRVTAYEADAALDLLRCEGLRPQTCVWCGTKFWLLAQRESNGWQFEPSLPLDDFRCHAYACRGAETTVLPGLG